MVSADVVAAPAASVAPAVPDAPAPPRVSWRVVAVVAALALLAWWVLRRPPATAVPELPMRPNATPQPAPLPGVPLSLSTKMAMVVDTQIPVVMTSGTPVPYDDDDIRQVVRSVLAKLNAMDESVTVIQVVSASKTQDSYKTVAYDVVASVHDAKENVGMLLDVSALVPVSGKLYVRKLQMHNKAPDTVAGPEAREGGGGGLAAYEDPVALLSKMKLA